MKLKLPEMVFYKIHEDMPSFEEMFVGQDIFVLYCTPQKCRPSGKVKILETGDSEHLYYDHISKNKGTLRKLDYNEYIKDRTYLCIDSDKIKDITGEEDTFLYNLDGDINSYLKKYLTLKRVDLNKYHYEDMLFS